MRGLGESGCNARAQAFAFTMIVSKQVREAVGITPSCERPVHRVSQTATALPPSSAPRGRRKAAQKTIGPQRSSARAPSCFTWRNPLPFREPAGCAGAPSLAAGSAKSESPTTNKRVPAAVRVGCFAPAGCAGAPHLRPRANKRVGRAEPSCEARQPRTEAVGLRTPSAPRGLLSTDLRAASPARSGLPAKAGIEERESERANKGESPTTNKGVSQCASKKSLVVYSPAAWRRLSSMGEANSRR